jgi:hypothetical protein
MYDILGFCLARGFLGVVELTQEGGMYCGVSGPPPPPPVSFLG